MVELSTFDKKVLLTTWEFTDIKFNKSDYERFKDFGRDEWKSRTGMSPDPSWVKCKDNSEICNYHISKYIVSIDADEEIIRKHKKAAENPLSLVNIRGY